jgi:hypothetical protein
MIPPTCSWCRLPPPRPRAIGQESTLVYAADEGASEHPCMAPSPPRVAPLLKQLHAAGAAAAPPPRPRKLAGAKRNCGAADTLEPPPIRDDVDNNALDAFNRSEALDTSSKVQVIWSHQADQPQRWHENQTRYKDGGCAHVLGSSETCHTRHRHCSHSSSTVPLSQEMFMYIWAR